MIKRFFIIILSVFGVTSCLGTHYFEPQVGKTSETEDKISHKGDTCGFEIEYKQVRTKFQPGMAFKPFKYVVETEGVEPEEPTIITKEDDLVALRNELERKYPKFIEKWYKMNGGYPNYHKTIIVFVIPENMTDSERTVKVKVSISNEYRDTEDWGEWETIFSAVQEGGY